MPARYFRLPLKIARGLRFRLTLSFVLFFALILTGTGLFFRGVLNRVQNDQVADILDEELAAVRGYLSFEKSASGVVPVWNYDKDEAEEVTIVERLRRVLLIADAGGRVLEVSEGYAALGIDMPEQIRAAANNNLPRITIRETADGVPYMVRFGVILDERRTFYVAIGRSLSENRVVLARFTQLYFAMLPLLILACGLLGWFVSSRALTPVHDLARRTEEISSTNLGLRIPTRNAGDELDDLIATFNKMVERLEQSFNQTRQFSTDVSHELRTPLTVIRGQLEVALMTATEESHYREAISKALEDVERLSSTVRALLHLSQAESGQLTLQRSELDLGRLVRDVVEQYTILGEAAQISMSAEAPDNCFIRGDRMQMERLLTNLISNALKYTPAGGRVTISVAKRGTRIELIVADTGQGIPAEALPHIFDRFYRVPTAQAEPERGLGLGLSFVAWIVRAHEGVIDVRSEVGKGSRFRVEFPGYTPAAPFLEPKEVHRV